MTGPLQTEYLETYLRGRFKGVIRWELLEEIWAGLRSDGSDSWYGYRVGEAPPAEPINGEPLAAFIDEIDTALHGKFDQRQCGLVYVDDPGDPAFIIAYHPNRVGG